MITRANPIDVEHYLNDFRFPSSKSDLLQTARQRGAPLDIIAALQGLPDREFRDATDAAKASFSPGEDALPEHYGSESCDD